MTRTADDSPNTIAPARGEAPAAREGDRPLTRRGRDTRARLIAAAKEMFNQTPYHETRVVDITRQAGVSAGSFYTYFDSKEALFRIVAHDVLQAMYSAARPDPDNADGNPVRDIAYASRQYFLTCREHRMVAQSIEQLRTVDAPVSSSRRETLLQGVKRTSRWIKRLQDRGICDSTVDPWYTGMALMSMNVSLAYDQLVHRNSPDDVEALVTAVTPIWARAVGLESWL